MMTTEQPFVPVVVRHTVDIVEVVHCEGNSVQGFGAYDASETTRVVGVPESLQNLTDSRHIQTHHYDPEHKIQYMFILSVCSSFSHYRVMLYK